MSEENRTNAPEEELTQEDINSLKKIRMDKLEELKAKGKNPFEITKYDVTASCAEAKAQYEKLEAELKEQAGEDEEKLKELLEANRITVSVAGRVMSRRLMGKASFFDLRDKSDKVQVYLRMNEIGKEEFDDYKKGDIGDIVGVEGFVFRDQNRRDNRSCSEDNTALQVPAAPAREVARSQGSGHPLPSEIR